MKPSDTPQTASSSSQEPAPMQAQLITPGMPPDFPASQTHGFVLITTTTEGRFNTAYTAQQLAYILQSQSDQTTVLIKVQSEKGPELDLKIQRRIIETILNETKLNELNKTISEFENTPEASRKPTYPYYYADALAMLSTLHHTSSGPEAARGTFIKAYNLVKDLKATTSET